MSAIGGAGSLSPVDPSSIDDTTGSTATDTAGSGLSAGLAADGTLSEIASGQGQIGLNSRGAGVRLVQDLVMKALGDPQAVGQSGADGWWGRNSMEGLKRFQEREGLPATGIVDRDTLIALDRAVNGGGAEPTASASEVMTRSLDDAVRDGVLGAAELKDAEAAISARYGPDVAKETLLGAFGVHAGKLDLEAVAYLQGKMGSMEGHIGRYQTLLDENLKGAHILDVNQDGKLDKDDLVFTKGADGTINVEKVGQARTDELRIAKAMVDACESMGEARHEFALIKDHRANPDFFTVESGGVFTLKPGASPSEAIEDFFKNPDEYGFECATAMVVVYYKAMLDLIGPKDFDRVCQGMTVGPWAYDSDLRAAKTLSSVGSGGRTELPSDAPAVRPGEYRYIRNWDVSDKSRAEGWQGENVIYMGEGKYYGHPFGVSNAEAIVAYLNGHRNEGSTTSSSFQDIRGFLSAKILSHDQIPE